MKKFTLLFLAIICVGIINAGAQCFSISVPSTTSYCSSGTLTVSDTGGVMPYTYLWSPGGQTTSTVNALSAGTYSVTVKDNTGCSETASGIVIAGIISYSVSGYPSTINPGDSALLTATCNIPASYSWTPSALITNATSSSTYAHPTTTTEYTVTITTSCGTYTDSVLINVLCFPISMSATPTCSSSSDGTAIVTISGGTPPYTYLWNPGGGTAAAITGLSAGNYSITVYDATGCSSSGSVSVSSQSESFTVSGSPTTIIAGDSILLTVTSRLSATYSWAPSTSVVNPDSATTYAHPTTTTEYTVTITTSCGTYTDSVLINVLCFPISMSATPTCSSSSDGTAIVTISGGTPPYTYLWNPGGGTAAAITGLSAGNYSITVYDATGCSSSGSVSVSSQSESFTVSGSPTTIIAGDSILLTVTSRLSATYSWAPSTSVVNPDSATTYAHPTTTTEYTVTITTSCGTYTDSVLINVLCFPISMSATPTCSSSSDGTAIVTISGGTPPYTYLWNPGGGTAAAITGLSAGNYSITVYDATGCSSSGSVSVSSQSESFTVSGSPTTIIAGDSILLTVTSRLSATYSWAPSTSVVNPDSAITYAHPVITTEYTVTITTACGTYTDSVLINVNCFNIAITSTSSYCASGTVTATPLGGTPPYTYFWSPTGGTTSTLTGLSNGIYSVTVHDAAGCFSSDSVFVSSPAISYSASAYPAIIGSGDSSLLTASCNAPATFSWAPPLSVTFPDSASTYAHPTASTFYTVTITTSCGTYIDSVLVTVNCFNVALSSTSSYCASGTVTATPSGGTPPYTYSWSPVGAITSTVTGLTVGTYSVTVDDATGCATTGTVVIASDTIVNFTATANPTNITAGDSSVLTATCSLPATYSWAPALSVTYPDSSGSYAHPSVSTEYTVTIITSCGTFTDSVLINIQCFTLTMASTNACGSSSNDGTATVTPSGGTPPYTYSWSPRGGTTSTITGLLAGRYSVNATDNTGCSVTGTVSVSSASESYSVSGIPLVIYPGDSSLLQVHSSLAATYLWTPSASVTNPTSDSTYAHPSATTQYTVAINTACGINYDYVTITVNCFPIDISSTPACNSSYDGTATVSASGGVPPYTYSWNPGGATTDSIGGLAPGSYKVTVFDATGCSSSATASVTPATERYSVSATPTTIVAGDSSQLNAYSTIAATYSWAPPGSLTFPTSSYTGAHPTTTTEYTVTINTPCGVYTDSVLVTVNCFSVALAATSSFCISGTITATASLGASPYTYSWSPGGQTTSTATGLSVGTYTVTVYDAAGCSVTASTILTNNSISYSVSANPIYLNPGDSSLLTATSNVPATYSWAPPLAVTYPDSSQTYAHPATTTEYTVTITTTCGTFTDSVLVNVNCFSLATSSTDSYNCSSSNDGSASVTASGGTPPYTYSWTPGGRTTSTISNLYAGGYNVTVHDATGCSSTAEVSVSSASISLVVSAFPPLINPGDSSYLSASVPVGATYSWAPSTGLSCTNCQHPWASPTVTTVYTVTVNDSCGTRQTGYDTVYVISCTNGFAQPLCIVTIDTATNQCEVIWDRTNAPPAAGYGSFYVYKDSAGSYGLTHSQPLNVLSEYIDPNSNPSAGPVSYELATLDSCGESVLSPPHTSIYLTTTAGVNVYILNWTAYVGFTPTLYRIFRGPSMSALVQIDSVPLTTLTYHDTLPPAGSTYMVEAVNPGGTCVPTTRGLFRPSAELSGSFSNGFYTALLSVSPVGSSDINLTIYPNPSNGLITIHWAVVNSQSSDVQISIINVLGQVVYSENIIAAKGTLGTTGTNTEQLNLSNLAEGSYTLRMQSNNSITMQKLEIIKQR